MRYPQGGGLTAERQQFREELRLKAAERFAKGEASSVIARDLRVSVRSVQRWRQMWDEGGPRALRSQGPASLPRLSQKRFAQLEAELAKGPAAHGWEDQRWTQSRVKTVIGRRFHLTYTIQGVRKLLVRNGWSCQVPARRAIERDDEAVAGWVLASGGGPTDPDLGAVDDAGRPARAEMVDDLGQRPQPHVRTDGAPPLGEQGPHLTDGPGDG
ncbi:hypothetical protein GCM10010381_57610 [Streptomyces xantholiticus]|nr:hypothetical protein GCM10010381_57610 [Streptomyces xantholiticus]